MSKVFLGDIAKERRETCKGSKYGYPIVGLEHLTPEEITLSAWEEGKDNTFTKLFSEGDILFGRRRAYLKKAAVAPFDGICSGDITVIQAIPEKILPELLPFIIQNDVLFDFAVGKSAGSLSPRVKWEHLKNYEFELPDMDKQVELAKVLWAMDITKKSYQNLLLKTDELVKSQYNELFCEENAKSNGWDFKPLGEVFDLGSGGTPARSKEEFWNNGTIPWVKISDMKSMYINNTEECITKLGLEKSSAKLLPKGTLIYSIFASLGEVSILNIDATTNQAIAGLVPKGDINVVYMYTALCSLKDYVLNIGRGAAQNNINMSILRSLCVAVPPVDIQDQFANFVKQSDKSKFELEQALAELTATYKKIISENLG